MEPEQPSPSDNQGWQQALNPGLTERLMRPVVRPGVIAQQPGRAILARMQHTGMNMPLLERVLRHAQSGEDAQARVPIVYAQNAPLTQTSAAQAPVASPPIVQAKQATAHTNAFVNSARPIPAPTENTRPIVQAARAAEPSAAGATAVPDLAMARVATPALIAPESDALPPAARLDSSPESRRVVLPAGRSLRRAPAAETTAPEIQRAPTELIQRAPARALPTAAGDQAPGEPVFQPASAVAPVANAAEQRALRTADAAGAVHVPVVVVPAAGRISAAAPIEAPRPSSIVSLAGSSANPPLSGASVMSSRPAVMPLQRWSDPNPPPLGPLASPGSRVDPIAGSIRPDGPLPAAGPALGQPIVVPIQRTSRAEPPRLARSTAAAMPMAISAGGAGSAAPTRRATSTIVQTMADAGAEPPAAELPASMASAPEPAADVSQVAEQVYSLLVQRLTSERERRGL